MPTPSRSKPPANRGRSKTHGSGASARRDLSRSFDTILTDEGWDAWRRQWAEHAPRPLVELAPDAGEFPLLWATPQECRDEVRRFLRAAGGLHAADHHARREFAGWLEQESTLAQLDRDAADFGLSCLARTHALPHLAQVMQPAAWRALLEQLIAASEEAAAIPLDHDPFGRLLLGGEISWTLTYYFPEFPECRRLASAATATLSDGLDELLDGEGILASRHYARLRPLLALWTRCGLLAREAGKDCFTRNARQQYAWFTSRAVLLSRPDGGQLLAAGEEGHWSEGLFEAALLLSADARTDQLARTVLPLRSKKRSATSETATSRPAFHSEWAEIGFLRPEASRQSPRLLVTYSERQLRAELTNRDDVAFTGDWAPRIEVAGRSLTPEGNWEEVCWVSDSDLDYLELEITLSGGWRVQRQMLLARKDEFLFAADAVLGPGANKIAYRCTAPLARGVAFVAEEETRDGRLEGRTRLATVMPLALPEWRVDRRIGSLEMSPGGLDLAMTVEGAALFAPLFFDLSKRRFKKQRTWRRLTVAERLQVQPPDVAVGFRVQVGNEQWLFYRSLAKAATRTVLGQNLASEFIAARFDAKGCAEELISVSTGS